VLGAILKRTVRPPLSRVADIVSQLDGKLQQNSPLLDVLTAVDGTQRDDGQGRRSAHTCNWLYKNMVMDANGRILPCCGAPRPDVHLVFANFPAETDCFNSSDYKRARSCFANGTAAIQPDHDGSAARVPHCENCKWDHSHTEVGRDQVALYLRTAGLPPAAIQLLADW
jgi:hypothetical protein